MQASNTDQSNSSESLCTPSVISPLEGCHGFYFKVFCAPYVTKQFLMLLYSVAVQMKIRVSGTGMSDFRSWPCTCCLMTGKWAKS